MLATQRSYSSAYRDHVWPVFVCNRLPFCDNPVDSTRCQESFYSIFLRGLSSVFQLLFVVPLIHLNKPGVPTHEDARNGHKTLAATVFGKENIASILVRNKLAKLILFMTLRIIRLTSASMPGALDSRNFMSSLVTEENQGESKACRKTVDARAPVGNLLLA